MFLNKNCLYLTNEYKKKLAFMKQNAHLRILKIYEGHKEPEVFFFRSNSLYIDFLPCTDPNASSSV